MSDSQTPTAPGMTEQPLPVEMGNSASWNSPTGSDVCSLGFKACDRETRKVVFVTNSHCNQNKTTCALATPGFPNTFWIHPGHRDVTQSLCITAGSCSAIGDITGHAAPSCESHNNFTDATKVESSSSQTSSAFRDIGFAQAGPGNPMPGDLVRKSGRTTSEKICRIGKSSANST